MSGCLVSHVLLLERLGFQSLFLPVRFSFEDDLMRIVGQTIHDGVGHHLVREDGRPVVKGSVARQDDGAGRVPAVDDHVKPFCGFLFESFEGELVENDQIAFAERPEESIGRASDVGFGERADEFAKFVKFHRQISPAGGVCERLSQVRLTGPGGTEEEDVFGPLDEPAGGQITDQGSVGGDGNVKVEGLERLACTEMGVLDQTGKFAVPPGLQFVGDEHGEEFGQGELTLLGFQKPHLQCVEHPGELQGAELGGKFGCITHGPLLLPAGSRRQDA